MTAVRRSILLLTLTTALAIAGAGSTAPAQASFADSKHAGGAPYWERLGRAKICLVPRGDTLETYRFFEAARAGSVIVSERLPSTWFYDDAPAMQLSDAREVFSMLDGAGFLDQRQIAWTLFKPNDAMTAAMDQRPGWRRLYAEALANDYRFLSFGDAMLLDRHA